MLPFAVIQMEGTMLFAHREFMANLAKSIELLVQDIDEAAEMTHICTDELAKIVYSISEPRWVTEDGSKKKSAT
ncbi:hypothetical protein JYT30_00955 [Desulfotalea psychrophila]|nr:hypothetical protein [Desulfotalea psychrophila]